MTSKMDPKALKRYVQFGKGKKLDQETVYSIIDNFAQFDEDQSGELSPEELVKCMKEYFRLHFKIKLDLVERLTKAKLSSVDKDKSGQLNLDEFFDLFVGVLEQIPESQKIRVSSSSIGEAENQTSQQKNSSKSESLKESLDGTLTNSDSKPQTEKLAQPELTSTSTNLTESSSSPSEVVSRGIDLTSDDLSTQEDEESQRRARNQPNNNTQDSTSGGLFQNETQAPQAETEKEDHPELTSTSINLTESSPSEVASREINFTSDDLSTQEAEESQRRARNQSNNNTPTEKQVSHTPTEKQASHTPTEKQTSQTPTEKQASQTPTEKPASQTPTEKQVSQTPTEKQASQTPTEKQVSQTPTEKQASHTPTEKQVAQNKVRVSFSLHYDTVFGENLFVVGESDELGNWEAHRGVRMAWWPGNYWSIDTYLPARNNIRWKYALVELEQGPWYVKRWEEIEPRFFTQQDLNNTSLNVSSPWNF